MSNLCKSVFIAATSQNDGKTTCSIALINELKKRNKNVGFIKPVGQQWVDVNGKKVDKDVFLIKNIYKLNADMQMMSPITVPKGFTKNYIVENLEGSQKYNEKILEAYKNISLNKNFMVIEGTGHAGVGSVFNMNNAQVAKLLNSKVVIVAQGGIGRPLDEIYMNKILFEKEGVEVVGVILNNVFKKKYDEIKHVMSIALNKMGLKLLGVIPRNSVLEAPTLYQIKQQIDGQIVNKGYMHENINNIVVGAMTAKNILKHVKKGTLIITPGDREDVILASLSSGLEDEVREHCIAGMVITAGIKPQKNINKLIQKTNIPVILSKEDTYKTASKIHDLLVKIMSEDKNKIGIAKNIIKHYVDFESILTYIK